MANNNPLNVATGKPKAEGAVFTAPEGTTLPTDAATALDADFDNLGFCSEDGMSNTVTTESQSFKDWGGIEVLVSQTSRTETYGYSMIETNATTMKKLYGDENVDVDAQTGAISIKHNSLEKVICSFVFEILLSGNRVKRIVVPRGKITAIDAVVYKANELIKYGVTLSALPDEDGNTAYEYIAVIEATG